MTKLLNTINNSSVVLKGVPEGKLYHYTNFEAFKKIIKSGVFLLSDYRDLKDNTELVWAFEYYINTIKPLFPFNMEFKNLLPEQYFVFCTCLRNNNRYLWENYASNQTGDCSGMVITLNAHAFYEQYSIKNRIVDMSPMEYDTEIFIRECKDSVDGLSPIAPYVMNGFNLPNADYQTRQAYLEKIPGYNKYEERRNGPVSMLTIQKGKEFIKEEEIRIINWQDTHTPLDEVLIDDKRKRKLPWRLKGGHFIEEIIHTEKSVWDDARILRFIRSCGVLCKVSSISTSLLT